MLKTLKGFKKNPEKAVTTVEYGVMLVLVAIAVLGASPGLSNAITAVFKNIATSLNVAV